MTKKTKNRNKKPTNGMPTENKDGIETLDGVTVETAPIEGGTVTWVTVINERGAEIVKKPVGKYITIESDAFTDVAANMEKHEELTKELVKALLKVIPPDGIALVVGIGNITVPADSLGVQTVSKIFVTNHVYDEIHIEGEEADNVHIRRVAAISPGVTGSTGMMTVDIIKGVCEHLKPSVVIAVDALSARAAKRVGTTIQIANTGIAPGGGMGGFKKAINEETTGCPVIAIGIPMVVDTATVIADGIDMIVEDMVEMYAGDGKEPFYKMLKDMRQQDKYTILRGLLDATNSNTFLERRDTYALIDRLSTILADGINLALNPDLEIENIRRLMY